MGFGRVLTSIQGLQQRLEDFSVEDVTRTEGNAQALALKLSQLQGKLGDLHNLKNLVASANARIGEITEENLDHVEPSGLEKYPDLHALVQADALIRRHGLTPPKKTAVLSNDPNVAGVTSEFSIGAANSSVDSPVPTALLAEDRADKIFPAEIEPGKADRSTPSIDESIATEEWVFSAEHEKHFIDDAVATHSADFELGTPVGNSTEAASEPPTAKSIKPTEHDRQAARSARTGSTSFDEQLLNELIESYGEFTVSSAATPSAPTSAPEPAAIESEIQRTPAESLAPAEPAPGETRAKAEAALIQTAVPATTIQEQSGSALETLPAPIAEPELVESKALVVPETPKSKKEQREARAKEKHLAAASKRGEIDRQLKNIIKDYGEYDLYSPRSSINFKLAAVGAFVVLGLVLGGFYFFNAPATSKPAAQSSAQTNPNAAANPPANKPENLSK